MKWTLLALLAALTLWSYAALRLIPSDVEDGVIRLTWVSDNNPARHDTIRLFEELHPMLRLSLDPTNAGLEKIIVQSKGGVGPDVFNVYGRWQLLDYVRTGVLLPLDEYAEAWGITPDHTWPEVLDEISVEAFNPETGRYERTQYTFPANVNADVMFYNKRIFDEAGVPYPPRDWTWDECLGVARRLVRRDARGRITRYALATYEMLETTGLIWQFGGDFFDPTLTWCVLDSPEAIEAITFLHRMLRVDEVMPTVAERDAMGAAGGWGGNILDLFAQERVAMIRIGRWALVTFRRYPDLIPHLGAVHVPHQREKVDLVRSMSVGINPQTPHLEESLTFLRFMASEDYSWQVARSADALPPLPSVTTDERFIHDPGNPHEDYNHLFAEAMHRGRSQQFSPFIQGARVERAFNRYLALMSEGRLSPEEMCRQLTREINRDIRENLIRYESMRDEYERRTGYPFDPDDFPPRGAGR